jgi:hypothetical protein
MKRRLILAIIAAITATGAFVILQQRGQPSYQGEPISYWMQLYPRYPHQAMPAIKAMGAQAMPFIISDLRARDSKFDVWMGGIRRRYEWLPGHSISESARHRRAVMACHELGTNAQSALPDLEALLPKQSDELNVTGAIAKTGVPGTFVLLRAFTNASFSPAIKAEIIGALHGTYYLFPGSCDPSRPVIYLTNQLSAAAAAVRRDAAEALGWICQLPEISVPALGALLVDPDGQVRLKAITSLGRFKRDTNAASFLRAGLDDMDEDVRLAAANALRDPLPRRNYE